MKFRVQTLSLTCFCLMSLILSACKRDNPAGLQPTETGVVSTTGSNGKTPIDVVPGPSGKSQPPQSHNDQLGGHARTLRIRLTRDLQLQAPEIDRGTLVFLPFMGGRQVPTASFYGSRPGAEPQCWVTVRYEKPGPYETLFLPAGELLIHQSALQSDDDIGHEGYKVTQVDFTFDAPTSAKLLDPEAGRVLRRLDGKSSKSHATTISCRGTDLRVADLSRAFGADLQGPL